LPDREGFAGAFAGVSGGALVVAGGANFPDRKPWEGGTKAWYDRVFVLDKLDGAWRQAGRLPRPCGYGVSVSCPRGVICVGGSDAAGHQTEVFALVWTNAQIRVDPLPPLPFPLATAGGALVEDTLYVTGGSERPGEQSALNKLLALNFGQARPSWQELEPVPGRGRILPVAAAANGIFYVFGGAALETKGGEVRRTYLREAWSYRRGQGWRRLADLPEPCVGAPSPAPVLGTEVLLAGGDDGSRTGFQPIDQHPGFPTGLWAYDAGLDVWRLAGRAPISRATAPTTYWQNRWLIVSGEVRPGVRSPEVWSLSIGP
jgi:N-acetylneuraminic acid mutarotase